MSGVRVWLPINLARGKVASANPWQANTLEWTVSSPPPHENFHKVPTVYRGPDEYSSPLVTEDWLPQGRTVDGARPSGVKEAPQPAVSPASD